MAIIIYLGQPGSGKSASAVREMYLDERGIKTYSNIITRGIPHNITLNNQMIVTKEILETKRKKDGTEVPVYDWKINIEFWKGVPKPINVIIDEAHNIINARRAMSKANVLITDWLALIRRVLGSAEATSGKLIFITQLVNRIDNIARDMATQLRYHICHFRKTCKQCHLSWNDNNENPEPTDKCYRCGSFDLMKHYHRIEVYHFTNITAYQGWSMYGMKTYHRHYFINDIEKIFPLYDTLQWENLFESIY